MSDEMSDRSVCGRLVGRASGWDQADTFCMMLYDFEPAQGWRGPTGGTVSFRFENGTVETYNDDGSVKESADMIEAISLCEVRRTDD